VLWIVDGGMINLPVMARVEGWRDGESIDITTGNESGEWNAMPTRYVVRGECHVYLDGNENYKAYRCDAWARCSELRELVEDMLDCIEICEAFGRPPTSEMCKEFAQRADELGIEVDG